MNHLLLLPLQFLIGQAATKFRHAGDAVNDTHGRDFADAREGTLIYEAAALTAAFHDGSWRFESVGTAVQATNR